MQALIASVAVALSTSLVMLFLGFSFGVVLFVCWLLVPVVFLALLVREACIKLTRAFRRKLGR